MAHITTDLHSTYNVYLIHLRVLYVHEEKFLCKIHCFHLYCRTGFSSYVRAWFYSRPQALHSISHVLHFEKLGIKGQGVRLSGQGH